MNPRRVEITLDQQTWDKLEAARLREPRASFVKRALESALGAGSSDRQSRGDDPRVVGSSPAPHPAPSRAPVDRAAAFRAASQKGQR